jgi:hypothetical protein
VRLGAILALIAAGLEAGTGFALGAITYVGASPANTTLQGGASLVIGSNCTSGSGDGAMDNLWHLRTGVGNSNGVWTADEAASGTEDVVPLVTTITFPSAGAYQLFAYVWDSTDPGEDWDVRMRVGTAGSFVKVQASEAEPANPARFDTTVVTTESPRSLMQIPLGIVIVGVGGTAQVYIDDDATIGSRRTWYDGVGYERAFGAAGDAVIALDFNKTNTPGAPSQAMFRIVTGSSTTSQNTTNITKAVDACTVQLSKTSATAFDFRGPNGDSTRWVPGGPTSLSALVADFIGARDGTINVGISNLTAGTYWFRSWHLDTFNTSNLGYSQGSSTTTQNTLRAHIGGNLAAITQPNALSTSGLATNFISDADIPTLSFPFTADGSNVVAINLSTIYTNGVDRFIFLNGFEVRSTTP